MYVDPTNASELAAIAREVGAEVVEGNLRYPSQSGSWQLGDMDLSEHLDRYRDQRLMVVFVPLGKAEKEPVICGICGFVIDEVGECPRCELALRSATDAIERRIQERDQLFDDIEGFLERGEE
jgi:hypothetical protein